MAYTDWPKQTVRVLVLMACTTAVVFQLSECIMKLSYPPVSTHTELNLNDSMAYPALTICRDPPYKPDVLAKYGLGSEIRYTSEWSNFPWNTSSLTEFWNEATYNRTEVFSQYGLAGRPANVNVTSNMYFLSGRCHTLRPLVSTQQIGLTVGYSVTLRHTTSVKDQAPWSIYIHQPSDIWTENVLQTTSVQELVLLPVGEEVQVKVVVQQLKRLNHPRRPCRPDYAYSATRCEQQCEWTELSRSVGCSVPWMPGTGLPECDTNEQMQLAMKSYLNFSKHPDCSKRCQRACYASHFSSYIVNRGNASYIRRSYSQMYVFHSHKVVTSVKEHTEYNLSRFVADAGGSLGFLLGVSVLSLVTLTGKAIRSAKQICSSSQEVEKTSAEEDCTSVSSSDSNASTVRSKAFLVTPAEDTLSYHF